MQGVLGRGVLPCHVCYLYLSQPLMCSCVLHQLLSLFAVSFFPSLSLTFPFLSTEILPSRTHNIIFCRRGHSCSWNYVLQCNPVLTLPPNACCKSRAGHFLSFPLNECNVAVCGSIQQLCQADCQAVDHATKFLEDAVKTLHFFSKLFTKLPR